MVHPFDQYDISIPDWEPQMGGMRLDHFPVPTNDEFHFHKNGWHQEFEAPDHCPSCGGQRWFDYKTEPEVGIEFVFDENGYLDEAKCDECGHTYYPLDGNHV